MGKPVLGIASDHGGYRLKEAILSYLMERGYEVVDFGATSPASVNYPDFAVALCHAMKEGQISQGILICGTGIGMSMVANRFGHIRAALCTDCYMAKMSREHNDANVLVMGERVLGEGLAQEIVATWLQATYQGGRHQKRLDLFPHGCEEIWNVID